MPFEDLRPSAVDDLDCALVTLIATYERQIIEIALRGLSLDTEAIFAARNKVNTLLDIQRDLANAKAKRSEKS